MQEVLIVSSAPDVWDALSHWVSFWQAKISDFDEGATDIEPVLVQDCQHLVGHLGALNWQTIPPERLSRSRSLTVEMHRQLILLRTDLKFLSVTRQMQKRSQLLAQVGDRFKHLDGYCEMAQQYFNGDSDEAEA